MKHQDSVDNLFCDVLINGLPQVEVWTLPHTDREAAYSMSASAAFRLLVGDKVQIGLCNNPDHIHDHFNNIFSGMLIKP